MSAWAAVKSAVKSALRFPAWGGQGIYSGGIYDWMAWSGGQGYDYREAAGPLHRNGTVMACLAWIMRAFTEPHLQVIKEDEAGEDNEIPHHPLTRAFKKPNPYYGSDCLWQRIAFDRSLNGQAFMYKMRNDRRKVVALYHVPQHRITPQWDSSGKQFISHYVLNVDARQERIPVEDLVHFRFGGDPDRERNGLAALGAGLREVGALNEGSNYRGAILRNLGVPSHLLQSKDPTRRIEPDAAAELHRLWAERVSGANRGKPIVPNWAMEAIKLGYSPEELDLGNMLDEPADLICALFGLSSMVVGLSSGTEHRTYCLPADARVETLDGGKPITEIQPGEQVWSRVGDLLLPRRVVHQWKTGTKPLLEIRTADRIVRATGNHPFLVRGKKWVCAEHLSRGDYITAARHREGSTQPYPDWRNPILSIRALPAEDVYDIEVEEGHSFVADGVVVHNSNYKEARAAATETALIPAWKQIGQELTLQLLPDYSTDETECVVFNTTNVRVLQDDESAKWTRIDKGVNTGWITINEARAMVNLPPVPGGDVFLPSAGEVPVNLAKPAPQDQAAVPASNGNGNGRTPVGTGA